MDDDSPDMIELMQDNLRDAEITKANVSLLHELASVCPNDRPQWLTTWLTQKALEQSKKVNEGLALARMLL